MFEHTEPRRVAAVSGLCLFAFIRFVVADGREVTNTIDRLRSTTIGDREVHDVDWVVGPLGSPTLLGETVLLKFGARNIWRTAWLGL